jgi:hypothetical protein
VKILDKSGKEGGYKSNKSSNAELDSFFLLLEGIKIKIICLSGVYKLLYSIERKFFLC